VLSANNRILIVDDNRAIHDDFEKILAPSRHQTSDLDALGADLFGEPVETSAVARTFELTSAFQGKEALEAVEKATAAGCPFALAIVDMRMPPGWDGVETIERLWKADRDLQIVICSAYADHSWEEVRSRLGDHDQLLILKKPFDAIEVVQLAHALTAKWSLAGKVKRQLSELEAEVGARTFELRRVNEQLASEIRLRDRVEAELRIAQKLEAVGQLASGVAHEINTPIQFVGDNLDFVGSGIADILAMAMKIIDISTRDSRDEVNAIAQAADYAYLSKELPPAITAIREGVERVGVIVRALKELSHPGLDERAPADLAHALENALVVTANSYRVVADLEKDIGELPLVTCNVGEISQVLLNLIVNAAHSMEGRPRGRLGIRAFVDDTDVVIAVSDTGCGIPEEARERVFDVFFTTKELGRGTGQGLAISRAIVVDRHGGSLTFDTTVDVGTTFYMRLPIRQRERRFA
jgi:two-component system NtrC family sensor kinase